MGRRWNKYIVVSWFLVNYRGTCFISWRCPFRDVKLKDIDYGDSQAKQKVWETNAVGRWSSPYLNLAAISLGLSLAMWFPRSGMFPLPSLPCSCLWWISYISFISSFSRQKYCCVSCFQESLHSGRASLILFKRPWVSQKTQTKKPIFLQHLAWNILYTGKFSNIYKLEGR